MKFIMIISCSLGLSFFCQAQNVGISETNPQARLHVKGSGIGYATATLLLQNSSGDPLINVRDNGYTGIGTAAPFARLHVKDNFETMRIEGSNSYISFFDGSTYKGYLWQKAGIAIELGTASGSYLPVTIAPNNNPEAYFAPGYTGIGNTNPSYRLDVSGRMRIRANGETAGIWFNNLSNTAAPAFVGMASDENYGFYDDLSDWSFLVNRYTGNVGIGTTPGGAGLMVRGGITSVLDVGTGADGTALQITGGGIIVYAAGINTPTTAFVHKATAGNSPSGLGYTVIDNIYCNNNPSAILQVTMNGTYGSGASLGYEIFPEVTSTGGTCQVLTPTSCIIFYNGPNSGIYASSPVYARDKWCVKVYTGCFVANPLNYNFNVFVIKTS